MKKFTDSIDAGIVDPEVNSWRDFRRELHRHVKDNPGKDILDCARYVLDFADSKAKEDISSELSKRCYKKDFPTAMAFESGDRTTDSVVAMYMGNILRDMVFDVDKKARARAAKKILDAHLKEHGRDF